MCRRQACEEFEPVGEGKSSCFIAQVKVITLNIICEYNIYVKTDCSYQVRLAFLYNIIDQYVAGFHMREIKF